MGKKSLVWDYFRTDVSNKVKKVVCVMCDKVVLSSGNTTNLYQHLKLNHKKDLSKLEELEKSAGNASLSGKARGNVSAPEQPIQNGDCQGSSSSCTGKAGIMIYLYQMTISKF